MNKLLFLTCLLIFFSKYEIYSQVISNSNVSENETIQVLQLGFIQPEELKVSFPNTNINLLAGNSIVLGNDINISGGSGNYIITWHSELFGTDTISPTIIISPQDTSLILVNIQDSKGCTTSELITVNVVQPLQVNANKNNVSCFGENNGSIELEVSKGAPPYIYTWSNGEITPAIINLLSGTYQLTITDSMGQTYQESYEISEPQQKESFIKESICYGDSYVFGLKTIMQTGNYTDTLKAGMGCDSLVHLSLVVNPLPEKPIITISGDTLISSSDNNQWYLNDNSISGATDKQFIIKTTGDYHVIAFDELGCYISSDTVSLIFSQITQFSKPAFDCLVYPNPNNGSFTLKLISNDKDNLTVQLFSTDGKIMGTQNIEVYQTGVEKQMEFGRLSRGIYYLRVTSNENTINKKIIIQ